MVTLVIAVGFVGGLTDLRDQVELYSFSSDSAGASIFMFRSLTGSRRKHATEPDVRFIISQYLEGQITYPRGQLLQSRRWLSKQTGKSLCRLEVMHSLKLR